MNEYEKAPERMMRVAATEELMGSHAGAGQSLIQDLANAAWPFKVRVAVALREAGVPEAERGWDNEDDVFTCTRSGYSFTGPDAGSGKVVDIAILGRTGVPDEVRQGERDALTQQARAALVAAGVEVRINAYGHLTAVNR